MVANWVSFNVIDTERQDWARGWAKLKEFVEREGHARVPYEHKEGAFPLGTWVAEQRRAYGAGQMNGRRAARLEKLGMAWSAADARFQENLRGLPLEKGVAALAAVHKARTGSVTVPRGHVEALPDGSEVKLGVFLSNTKTRRAKLTADKLAALAGLGLEWAAAREVA